MSKKTEKTEAKNEKTENKTATINVNQILKSLVAAGETFNPEWLDMSPQELCKLLSEIKTRQAAFNEIKTLVSTKTLQTQQLLGVLLYNDPQAFDNKVQSWAVSLARVCCSAEFKAFINSNKSLNDIKTFLSTCKDK